MTVLYKLREVCAWSVTPNAQMQKIVEHRYVEVECTDSAGSQQTQILELPTTEAVHLCASMATDSTLVHLMEDAHHKWWNPSGQCSLPGLMQLLAKAASKHTKWLEHLECKYVNVRVDMRSGHFVITDSRGAEASEKVFSMLDWANGNKPNDN